MIQPSMPMAAHSRKQPGNGDPGSAAAFPTAEAVGLGETLTFPTERSSN